MADKVQSYENHAQIVPMYHYVTLGILQLTFIGACVNLYQSWGDHARFYSASLLVTLTLATILAALCARSFALKAQDRLPVHLLIFKDFSHLCPWQPCGRRAVLKHRRD